MGVSRIHVVVASTSPDLEAEGIARSVASHSDMNLVEGRCFSTQDIDRVLESIPPATPCALVLVERVSESDEPARRWLAKRSDLVVLRVDIKGHVRIGLRDPRLESLLAALRELVEGVTGNNRERIARIQLESGGSPAPEGPDISQVLTQRPLLRAVINWVHKVLRDAVADVSDENGDVHGLSVTRATLLHALDTTPPEDQPTEVREAEKALEDALKDPTNSSEPLAILMSALGLTFLEFRMLLVGLAPELDLRFQRCIGFLLDEMGRRVGSSGLYSNLLGPTVRVREELAQSGALARWLVFESERGRQAAADEPLRVDPFLVRWLLGEQDALTSDPRVRRLLRLVPWPGARLLRRRQELANASSLVSRIQDSKTPGWLLFGGAEAAAWRALLELGAQSSELTLLRIETSRLSSPDLIEIEDCARCVARLKRLAGAPIVVDVNDGESTQDEESVRLFFAALNAAGVHGGVISRDEAQVVQLLGPAAHELADTPALSLDARIDAVSNAARAADVYLTNETAEAIARRYPLQVDGLERAMRLARTRPLEYGAEDPQLSRFTSACKDVASEGVSHLAERIEPIFTLDQVVLPDDRKQQLNEIVDHVRLAGRVLDEWNFRDQLPYGRGVTALFFGPSGAGKTMAAMGIARRLGIQILRLDLSKVVSKYIGDTEKNMDRVFTDAQGSGSAILIDEAEALLGKRSEVKDAHDRYANIEVAYLLQRMEAFEGLAILTTNLRQNLDPAFLRRLRFIVGFPRPDMAARLQIWRQCLPEGSHVLDDVDFRQLARKIDLTGGHIRQISLCAAFIAAAAGVLINLEHIEHAAKAEFAKLGMPPVEFDPPATKVYA
ncbi:MAG: ATP-binding protein [Acidobacteriaceae bacterium]